MTVFLFHLRILEDKRQHFCHQNCYCLQRLHCRNELKKFFDISFHMCTEEKKTASIEMSIAPTVLTFPK